MGYGQRKLPDVVSCEFEIARHQIRLNKIPENGVRNLRDDVNKAETNSWASEAMMWLRVVENERLLKKRFALKVKKTWIGEDIKASVVLFC